MLIHTTELKILPMSITYSLSLFIVEYKSDRIAGINTNLVLHTQNEI